MADLTNPIAALNSKDGDFLLHTALKTYLTDLHHELNRQKEEGQDSESVLAFAMEKLVVFPTPRTSSENKTETFLALCKELSPKGLRLIEVIMDELATW